jgi:hypothetical protein
MIQGMTQDEEKQGWDDCILCEVASQCSSKNQWHLAVAMIVCEAMAEQTVIWREFECACTLQLVYMPVYNEP